MAGAQPPRVLVRELLGYDRLLRRLAAEDRLDEAHQALTEIDRLRERLRAERMLEAR